MKLEERMSTRNSAPHVKTGDSRYMGSCRLPLVHAYDHKQGGHGKINACGVKGNELTHKGAQHWPGYPVALIKKAVKKVAAFHSLSVKSAGRAMEHNRE